MILMVKYWNQIVNEIYRPRTPRGCHTQERKMENKEYAMIATFLMNLCKGTKPEDCKHGYSSSVMIMDKMKMSYEDREMVFRYCKN